MDEESFVDCSNHADCVAALIVYVEACLWWTGHFVQMIVKVRFQNRSALKAITSRSPDADTAYTLPDKAFPYETSNPPA